MPDSLKILVDNKNKHWLYFCLIISFIALIIRVFARDFISYDMQAFLLPWFQTIQRKGGFIALNEQVGDYGLLFQTIIALFSYFNVNPVYLYKIIPIVFDFLLAFSIASFIYNIPFNAISNSKAGNGFKKSCLIYACVLLLPTIIFNSSFWGQCDSIYTFFLLWSIWFLYKEKYKLSFFMLGGAFAFKLQSILILPLYAYLYFYKKSFSLYYFLITLITFWFSGIVAYIYGRGLLDGFGIYFYQVGEYKRMWLNVPSFWALIEADYNKFCVFAICLTFIILGLGLYAIIKSGKQTDDFEQIIKLAIFIEWTCIIFLPAMHERYTYVLDLLLLMLAFINTKYVKYAFVSIVTSCMTYSAYLFTGKIINSSLIIIYIFCWLLYSYNLFTIYFCGSHDSIH